MSICENLNAFRVCGSALFSHFFRMHDRQLIQMMLYNYTNLSELMNYAEETVLCIWVSTSIQTRQLAVSGTF